MTNEIGRVKYYHGRDDEEKPRATVCLISVKCRDGSVDVAKGVSICSNEDSPNKFIGRRRAWARAMRALKNQESTGHIYAQKAWDVLFKLNFDCFGLIFSSAFNPTLTDLDKKLLEINDV